MTNNEIELLSMIRENDNPEQALMTAFEIILSHLIHPEASVLKSSVEFLEYV